MRRVRIRADQRLRTEEKGEEAGNDPAPASSLTIIGGVIFYKPDIGVIESPPRAAGEEPIYGGLWRWTQVWKLRKVRAAVAHWPHLIHAVSPLVGLLVSFTTNFVK
jgi:hypothetical protein